MLVCPAASGPLLRGLHQGATDAPPSCGRVDGKQADVGTVVALDRGNDAGAGRSEDHRGLIAREERAVELVFRRRVGDGPPAKLRDSPEVGAVEALDVGHRTRT